MKTKTIFAVLFCVLFSACLPIDSNDFKTVVIGDQEWMAENLAIKPSRGNYWAYENNNANVSIYGYLYDWEAARSVCPSGWHLPTESDWNRLLTFVIANGYGGSYAAALKATASHSPPWNGTDNFGFSALPAGLSYEGNFEGLGSKTYWWTATESSSTRAHIFGLWQLQAAAFQGTSDKGAGGYSVRCVKDN